MRKKPTILCLIASTVLLWLLSIACARSAPDLAPSPQQSSTQPSSTPTAARDTPRLVGYFYGLDQHNQVPGIPAAQLTAVLYAFVDVSKAGECVSADAAADQMNFPQLRQLKQQHEQLSLLISAGGYSRSKYFSDAAATGERRLRFAQSCVLFMKQNGFDGIDIDWEIPVSGGQAGNMHRPEDKQDFTALLAELRGQLDAQSASDKRHYLLTVAAPIGPNEYKNIELNALPQYLDWINLMAYAFYTANSPVTNFNAPLYASSTDPAPEQKRRNLNADAAVKAYLAAGVPANKIVLGVPFYGRGWQGVPDVNHGLYQSANGPATDPSVPNGTWQEGATSFASLEKYYLNAYPRYWHDETQEPWLYNPSTGIMITYEDPQSLEAKAAYVVAHHLGGMMIWHLSADDAQHTLVNALAAGLQQGP